MKLHHIGIVVDDIERLRPFYIEMLGMEPLSSVVADPIQRVKVQFLGDASSVCLELIQPMGEGSPVSLFLNKGGGLYHMCFKVKDLDLFLVNVQSMGGIIAKGPDPALAFDGRRVAFVVFREVGLVEFVEGADHES